MRSHDVDLRLPEKKGSSTTTSTIERQQQIVQGEKNLVDDVAMSEVLPAGTLPQLTTTRRGVNKRVRQRSVRFNDTVAVKTFDATASPRGVTDFGVYRCGEDNTTDSNSDSSNSDEDENDDDAAEGAELARLAHSAPPTQLVFSDDSLLEKIFSLISPSTSAGSVCRTFAIAGKIERSWRTAIHRSSATIRFAKTRTEWRELFATRTAYAPCRSSNHTTGEGKKKLAAVVSGTTAQRLNSYSSPFPELIKAAKHMQAVSRITLSHDRLNKVDRYVESLTHCLKMEARKQKATLRFRKLVGVAGDQMDLEKFRHFLAEAGTFYENNFNYS
jgi:hypothetical protein